MNRNVKAHIAVLIANIIYGANYSIAKLIMPVFIKPFGFIVIRVLVSAVLFFISSKIFVNEKVERADKLKLVLCSIFGVAVNQLFFFKGLSLTSPINAGLIMVTNPIFVLLLVAIFLNEKINLNRIIGIIFGLTGAVLLIVYGNRFSTTNGNAVGDLFILLNSLSYAVYLVMVKPLMTKYHPITIMRYIFFVGAFWVLPFGFSEFNEINWSEFTPDLWKALAFVVVGTTFFAYLFNTMALRELSPGTVSVYIYLQPAMAAFFAMALGKDQLSLIHIIAATFIFVGVYLSTKSAAKV
jgi:drug/metabolite transporter (DMT)-like permease